MKALSAHSNRFHLAFLLFEKSSKLAHEAKANSYSSSLTAVLRSRSRAEELTKTEFPDRSDSAFEIAHWYADIRNFSVLLGTAATLM